MIFLSIFYLYVISFSWGTGKSVPEALILESVNPQYDDRLFIDLQLQYEKNKSSKHDVYKNRFLFWSSKQFLYTTWQCCNMIWTRNSVNNLLSYCGLTDSRLSASEKDLVVSTAWNFSFMPSVLKLDNADIFNTFWLMFFFSFERSIGMICFRNVWNLPVYSNFHIISTKIRSAFLSIFLCEL